MPPASTPGSRPPCRSPWLAACLLGLGLAAAAGLLLSFPRLHAPARSWPTVARSNLVLRADRWYPLQSTNPFTGWIEDDYPDGSHRSRISVSNGLLDGVCESWFANGQMQSHEYFTHGVSNGRRKNWYADGRLESQADIVNGKMEGVFRRWYTNGQLAEVIPMKNGRPDGSALDYYPSGYTKAETRVRAGQVLARKRWPDGEHREVSLADSPAHNDN